MIFCNDCKLTFLLNVFDVAYSFACERAQVIDDEGSDIVQLSEVTPLIEV